MYLSDQGSNLIGNKQKNCLRFIIPLIREFKIPVPVVTGTAKCNNDVISSQVELVA